MAQEISVPSKLSTEDWAPKRLEVKVSEAISRSWSASTPETWAIRSACPANRLRQDEDELHGERSMYFPITSRGKLSRGLVVELKLEIFLKF